MRDRAPSRFGEALDLRFAERRDAPCRDRFAAGFGVDLEQSRLDRLDRAEGQMRQRP
jgi:hypothetical protein